jgi:hypothetical protein
MRIRLLILIMMIISFWSCVLRESDVQNKRPDKLDYKIYSIAIIKCLVPAIDSSLKQDVGIEKFRLNNNPKRNLMLMDSTMNFSAEDLGIKKSYINDSILFLNFLKQNEDRMSIDTCFRISAKFYKISRSAFYRFLSKNRSNGYMEIYKKHPDVNGIIELSAIGYNTDKSRALVEISFYNSPNNNFNIIVRLENIDSTWMVIDKKIEQGVHFRMNNFKD